MITLLNASCKKISSFLGMPEMGIREDLRHQDSIHEQIFKFDHLSSMLGYEYVETCEKMGQDHTFIVSRESVGFVIESIPIVGGSLDTHKTILELIDELLEEGVSIQCLLLADHKINDLFKYHVQKRAPNGELFFEMIRQRALNFSNLKTNSVRDFRFIFSVSLRGKPSAELYNNLIEKKQRSLKTLNDLSYSYIWDVDDFLLNVSALINFDESITTDHRKFNPLQSLASQIPHGGKITVKEDGLVWEKTNSIKHKSFRAVDFPDYWNLSNMNRLIGDFEKNSLRINAPFYIQYAIHCPEQSYVEKMYSIRSSIVEKQGRSSFLTRMIPELVDEVRDAEHVRNVRRMGDKFVYTCLSTGFWAPENKVESIEQTLKSLWKMNNFKIQENRYIHLPSYLSMLPMSWGEFAKDLKDLGILRTTLSSEIANFIPIQGEWCGTPSSGVLLMGRRGQLCNFNVFDGGTNYNAIVVGESGSGKSVFMQEILMNNIGTGGKVYVIDVGGSFEKMCEVLEGQKIEFNNQKIEFNKQIKLCLNPFSNIPLEDSEELSAYFGALKSIVSTMAHPIEGSSDLENALIEKAILKVWKEKKNQATITDLADHLESQCEREAKNLAIMLGPFTKTGTHAGYFEGKANINFHNKMVLIELEQLKSMPELQSVILQIFILEINRQIFLGDRKTPTIICIDEAWELLTVKQTAPFIETLARRLRKYNGSLVVGTQSVEDFYRSKGSMAAYDNSCWMCLLSQGPESISAYAKKSNCSEGQLEVLKTVRKKGGEYSEIMISSENGYSVSRLVLDPFSQLLYSTEPDDRSNIEPYRKQGLSITETINKVLAERKR
jgi:conjugal transfer ATP-binding protein TraC